ncbi:hypothetical protein [Bartonella sp. DGB2]
MAFEDLKAESAVLFEEIVNKLEGMSLSADLVELEKKLECGFDA